MKKPLRIILIVLASLAFLAAALAVYINVDFGKSPDMAAIPSQLGSLSPRSAALDGVPQYTQPDAYSCGATTIAITASYLSGVEITPESLIAKYSLPGGMKTDRFIEILSKELPDYTVTFAHGMSDAKLLEAIHSQLAAGMPVPVFFGALNPYNKPWYDFHTSVVTGLDLDNGQVDIANAYGYSEQVAFDEFLDRMSYRGGSKYPLVQRAVVKFGLMDRNAIVLITKNK